MNNPNAQNPNSMFQGNPPPFLGGCTVAAQPPSAKALLKELVAQKRKRAHELLKEANDFEILDGNLPELMNGQADLALRTLIHRCGATLLLLLMLVMAPRAMAQNTFAPALAFSNVLTNLNVPASWCWTGESNEIWLTVTAPSETNTVPAVVKIESQFEPVVTKGTNGFWTITFPHELKPGERITTVGEATAAANQMFEQGAGFGALAKDRNKDVEDVRSLVAIARKLWENAKGGK